MTNTIKIKSKVNLPDYASDHFFYSQVDAAFNNACSYFMKNQLNTGGWEGEVWWCPLPTAQVVFTHKIIGQSISKAKSHEILRYFRLTQRTDGGWGFHDESHSYRYVTTLVYIAARLLGMSQNSRMLLKAHRWLHSNSGNVESIPTQGKCWLAILGLYDWKFVNVSGPEMFLLPHWFFLSPVRFYCHTRSLYRSLAYLKSIQFQHNLGELAQDIYYELYGAAITEDNNEKRHAYRHTIAESDVFQTPSRGLRILYDVQRQIETLLPYIPYMKRVRQHALAKCFDRIRAEQYRSNFQGLSSLSSTMNILVLWHENPTDEAVSCSVKMLESWRWDSESEGSRYAGARSTTWDTAFTLQALTASNQVMEHFKPVIRAAYHRLLKMQISDELPNEDRDERDSNAGGWCFNDSTHQWAISDCTAEAISALLCCHHIDGLISIKDRIEKTRLQAAISFLLTRQNADGGFGSYERSRGGQWLNKFNPAEIYGSSMTEQSYIECTASALRVLSVFVQDYPELSSAHISRAIDKSRHFLCSQQREDGTWQAAWGINLIYSTWFAVEALCISQFPVSHSTLNKAAVWLKAIQHADGGWGEHFSGCHTGTFIDNPTSTVVCTSWASLALMAIEGPKSEAAKHGIMWLVKHQQKDGAWLSDAVNGVFFRTAMLDYRLYNCYFPTLALAKANAHRGNLR